jgi:hypothetical protein
MFLHKFAPHRFDCFDLCPSQGASGGILVAWCSRVFSAVTIDSQVFALRLLVTSVHDLSVWNLIIIYGPTRKPDRLNFVSWLYSLDISIDEHFLILEDSTSIEQLQTGISQKAM